MIPDFKAPQELIDWLTRWRSSTRHTRARRAWYRAKGSAYFCGIQHLQSGNMLSSFAAEYTAPNGQAWTDVYQGNEPMKTTLNKITTTIVQAAAGSSFNALDLSAVPRAGDEDPMKLVLSDIIETAANVAADMMRLIPALEQANFERYIDAMHGVGFRLLRADIPGPDGQSVPDYRMESFDFDGHMLTLDPTCRSRDLRDHPFVILTDAMTFEAAKRRYGPEAFEGVNPDKLPRLGKLRPTELHFHGVTKGTMYTDIAECAHEPGVLVHEIYAKTYGYRFDRYYVVADDLGDSTKNEMGKRVIRGDGQNPYGGCGLPMGVLCGDRRPGEIFPISAVAQLTDTQDKINVVETLYLQQLWDYTTKHVTYIDEGWFGRNKADRADIMAMIQSGYVFGNGAGRFQPPALVDRPPPHQGLAMDADRYTGHLREAGRLTPMHVGQVKTHVADSTHQTALELVERPDDERRAEDVRVIEAIMEVAAGTVIMAVQARAPSVIQALSDAGVKDAQLARMLTMDPVGLHGVKMSINPEATRRRSRGQAKRDFLALIQYGAHENPVVRQAMAALDSPVFDTDKQVERWANQQASNVLNGLPYEAVPMQEMVAVAFTALRKAMMSDAARRRPEIMQALKDAWNEQMAIEMEFSGVPLDPGMQEEPPPEEGGATMDQLFGSVAIR